MMDPAVFYPYNEQDEEHVNEVGEGGSHGGEALGTPGAQHTERIEVENGEWTGIESSLNIFHALHLKGHFVFHCCGMEIHIGTTGRTLLVLLQWYWLYKETEHIFSPCTLE